MDANQWRSRTAAWLSRQRRSTPAPFIYVVPALPGCCVRGETLCVSVLTCVLMSVYVCVCVCERACVTPKTAVLVRVRNPGSCPPCPQSRVSVFCEYSLKLVVLLLYVIVFPASILVKSSCTPVIKCNCAPMVKSGCAVVKNGQSC